MSVDSKSELVAIIQDELARTDLNGAVDQWITNFESNFNRDITHRLMQVQIPLTLTGGVGTVALPDDFISAQTVYLNTDPARVLAVSAIQNLIADYPAAASGLPQGYAIVGSNLIFRPVPDADYSASMVYYQRLSPLVLDGDSNWLLATFPDVYIYGSLVWSAPYLEADPRLQVWLGLYDRAIASLKGDDSHSRYSGAPVKPSLDVQIV